MGLCSLTVFDLRPNYGGSDEDNGDLLHKEVSMHCRPQCPQPTPPRETPGHSWASLDQSLVEVTAPFSWVLVGTRFCLCPPRVCFPVLCKFWQLYGGVNAADLLQEGLCHTQVCCTQSPCPCGSPLLTCTSTGHTHRQVWLISVGFPGVHKVLLEPSKCLMGMGFD